MNGRISSLKIRVLSRAVILILIFLAILSCDFFLQSTKDKNNNETQDVSDGTTTIQFGIPAGARGLSGSRSTTSTEGQYLYWVEQAYRFRSPPQYQALEEGSNSITVDKDRTVVMSIIEDPYASAKSSRDLSSAVSMVGNLSVVSAGLDSLPVLDQAEGTVDLGEVQANTAEHQVESLVSSSEIANDLGLNEESVRSYGRYDQVYAKYRNLDIDRNGTLDSEDSLSWNMITETIFPMTDQFYDIQTGTFMVEPSDFYAEKVKYYFIWKDPTSYIGYTAEGLPGNGTLYLPENPSGIQTLQTFGTYTISYGANESEYDDGGTLRYLKFEATDDIAAVAPLDGDYEVLIQQPDPQEGEWRFYLDDMKFLKPADGFEGFIFPIIRYETDENDIVQTVSWSWKKIENGRFLDATEEEIKLQVKSFLLAFDNYDISPMDQLTLIQRLQDPDDLWYVKTSHMWYGFKLGIGIYDNQDTDDTKTSINASYYQDATLDLSSYNYTFQYDAHSLVVLTEDSAGNFYGFRNSPDAVVQ